MAGDGLGKMWIGAAALALVVGACGGDDDEVSSTDDIADAATGDDVATDGATDDGAGEAASTAADDSESTVGTTAVPSEPLAETALPGDPFDLFPGAGAAMTVVGVAADDILNVRVGPGPEYDVVTTLAPTSDGDALATGRNRSVDSGVWAEIEIGTVVGWANTTYLLQSASVDDDTTNLYPTPADHPTGESLDKLGRQVAGTYASIEPLSRLVVSDGPNLGDPASITVDVIGLGDDSVGGYRVVVFAEPVDDGYRVRTVETTTLCTRGVDGGMCV